MCSSDLARARGRELWAQVGCFPLGMEFTLRHPYPLEAFLAWRPATVARGEKRRVHDLPTGAERLDTPAVGVHGVWVNGVRTVDERGIVADCGRPGRVLRDFPA